MVRSRWRQVVVGSELGWSEDGEVRIGKGEVKVDADYVI